MPILEIASMDGPPLPAARLPLFQIEAVMLWPADETMRQEYLQAAKVAWAVKNVPDGLSIDKENLGWFADAQPLTALQKLAIPRYYEGCLAGHIMCVLLTDKPAVNLTEAKKRASQVFRRFVGKRPAWSKTPMLKQIDNEIWPRFKSAAHLWGAYIAMCSGGDHVFPCRSDRLATFLKTADSMLQAGASHRAPRAPAAVLDYQKAWRVQPLRHQTTRPLS